MVSSFFLPGWFKYDIILIQRELSYLFNLGRIGMKRGLVVLLFFLNSFLSITFPISYGYSFTIYKTAVSPVIDGDLAEYTGADSVSVSPATGGNTMTVRALWNTDALYLAYEVSDTDLNAPWTLRDNELSLNDSVEWAIDSLNNNGGSGDPDLPYMLPDDYLGFITVRSPGRYDSRGTPSGIPTSSWDGSWQSAVQYNGTLNDNSDADDGYTVEVKIPWNVIGYISAPSTDTNVGIGFLLNDKDASSSANAMWPPGGGSAFENASNWQEVTISTIKVWYRDFDEDGYGDPANFLRHAAQPEGYISNNRDCDDTNAALSPSAAEVCDEIDNNCDGCVDCDRDAYQQGVCGGVIYVEPSDYCGGNTPCFSTISDAVHAIRGGEIRVAQGTYQGNVWPRYGSTIDLIQGGWSSDFSSRSMDPSVTIIDGMLTSQSGWLLNGFKKIEGLTIKEGVELSCRELPTIYTSSMELSNNIITGGGISVNAWWCSLRLDLLNNLIYGNVKGIQLKPLGIDMYRGGISARLINNTLVNNDIGIEIYKHEYIGGGAGVSLVNTIVWNNGDDIYLTGDGGVSASHSNIGTINNAGGTFHDDGTNMSVDPLFRDPANRDYRLTKNSPLIDAGINMEEREGDLFQNGHPGTPDHDFEGDNRPLDGNGDGMAVSDIGADEYTFGLLKTDASPTIDGILLEYDSAGAVVLSPSTGGNTAEVKMLWDDEALYIAYEVTDTELNAEVTTRDGGVWSEDSVEWFIDTLGDDGGSGDPGSPYMLPDDYHGIVNILNTQYDSQGTVTGTPSAVWNGNWQSAVVMRGSNNDNGDSDTGYTVEVKIPWLEIGLSGPPEADSKIRFAVAVNDKDGSSYANAMWPPGGGSSFENASNWQEVQLQYPLTHYYCDEDGDGYVGVASDGTCTGVGCEPEGCQTTAGTDCRDNSSDSNPDAREICDAIDNDCDGLIDDGTCFSGDLHVEPSGTCGGMTPCFTTIQQAVDAASDSAVIKIAQGKYDENILINKFDSLLETLIIEGGWDSLFTSKSDDSSLTVVDGDIDGDETAVGDVFYLMPSQRDTYGYASSGQRYTISGLTIQNGRNGVYLANQPFLQQLYLNMINNIISGNGDGIYVTSNTEATYLNVTGNEIHSNSGSGIFLEEFGGFAVIDASLINNMIYGNGDSGVSVALIRGYIPLDIINNTITNNTAAYGGGLRLTSTSQTGCLALNVNIRNTIIRGNSAPGFGNDIYIKDVPNPCVTVNTSYSDIGDVFNDPVNPGTYNDLGNNMNVDPLFVDQAGGNYHLTSLSPLIDEGSNNEAPVVDFEHHARPVDGDGDAVWTTDIGADEYIPCSTPSLYYRDADGDGYGDINNTAFACSLITAYTIDNTDCDDSDASINPSAVETWYNGVDQDCDGWNDYDQDMDAFVDSLYNYFAGGTSPGTDDCDDTNSTINPFTYWHPDSDGDSYGNPTSSLQQCSQPMDYVLDDTDCDDYNANIYPGGPPVRVLGTADAYYWSFQSAYDNPVTVDGDIIQSKTITFNENLNISRNMSLTLTGGYDCGYSVITGTTVVNGHMTIQDGSVTIENFELQ